MSSQTSNLGTIGELAITSHLIESGYEVYKGVTGAESTDVIAYKDGKFTRVQVKCQTMKHGRVGFSRLSGGYRQNKVLQGNEFDVMALYVHEKRFCLFMHINQIIKKRSGVAVRIDPAKNGAVKNIHSYEDFLSFEKAINHS